MPMPIDLYIEYTDGTQESVYIPLRMMRKNKENPFPSIDRSILKDWPWTNPTYSFEISKPKSKIKSIKIDITSKIADINSTNNSFSQ